MPACYCSIIIGNIPCIPSKNHIAKAKTIFGNGYEIFQS